MLILIINALSESFGYFQVSLLSFPRTFNMYITIL